MSRVKYKIISILMAATVICSTFCFGQFIGPTSSYAADQGLGSSGKTTWTVTDTSSIPVSLTGIYQITAEGGAARNVLGGKLSATIKLEKGETVSVVKYVGGVGGRDPYGQNGGDAIAVFINNVLVIGAGGAGGGGCVAVTATEYRNGTPVTLINNQLFSSGGGGTLNNKGDMSKGSPGKTAVGCAPASGSGDPRGGGMAQAGANYLLTAKMTLQSQTNNGSAPVATVALDTSATLIEHIEKSSSNTSVEPTRIQMTVCQNQEFSIPILGYDNLSTAAIGEGVKLENISQTDKYIVIKGNIQAAGVKVLQTQGVDIMISVLEEPSAANVKVVLN